MVSPWTTTAPVAARKPSTTARTPAPAALSGTNLTALLRVDESQGPVATAAKLLAALCGAQRPESIHT
ncbi:hypothetical protein [Arthrobacter sp. Hiyo1]|uniref:hypothetical protein n=1 Tax=Arthrobacter sp. Hiyo1 TaxID=1588020 RepID=UPI00209BD0E3|nr:hypothetical protein [Arthrobacter sp. Hiyo1]